MDGAAEEEMRMRTSGWWKECSHTSAVGGEGMSKKPRSGFWKPGERVDERVFLFFMSIFYFIGLVHSQLQLPPTALCQF